MIALATNRTECISELSLVHYKWCLGEHLIIATMVIVQMRVDDVMQISS